MYVQHIPRQADWSSKPCTISSPKPCAWTGSLACPAQQLVSAAILPRLSACGTALLGGTCGREANRSALIVVLGRKRCRYAHPQTGGAPKQGVPRAVEALRACCPTGQYLSYGLSQISFQASSLPFSNAETPVSKEPAQRAVITPPRLTCITGSTGGCI